MSAQLVRLSTWGGPIAAVLAAAGVDTSAVHARRTHSSSNGCCWYIPRAELRGLPRWSAPSARAVAAAFNAGAPCARSVPDPFGAGSALLRAELERQGDGSYSVVVTV